MTPQEVKENGQRLFKDGQYADAIPLLKSAAEVFPNDESLWQELVLAAHYGGQYEQAVEFAKQGIFKHPGSGWLWRQLGSELTAADRLDEAEKAFNNARSILSPTDEWLWRYIAALHRKRKNLEKEIEALENLSELDNATWTDLNELGIAYYNHKNFAKAVKYYKLSAAIKLDAAPLFNMGLVFNDPEVSQDSDAADAYRRVLALNPDHANAKKMFDTIKQKLVPLAERAVAAATGLVQSDGLFQFYVNPFEVLQYSAFESVEELDMKVIQKAKKLLLAEIELNDGKVGWLNDYPLDKSRALAMVDELDNTDQRRYHWAVFLNKRLLDFMSRGDLRHFLYSDYYFPYETLDLLDKEPKFRAFLSKPFARQYNFVLTHAIERRLLPVIEVLFDGRRWVEPGDEDICFEGTLKRVQVLVEQMEDMEHQSTETKITAAKIEDFLSRQSVPEIFNLLPTAFRGEQNRIVAAMRQVAVACHNEHDDSEESAKILKLCKKFQFKSVDLNKLLEDDAKAIEAILKEKEKQKVFANLKPIKAAPSLNTTNGIGFQLYGHADYDIATDSYIATYYFVFLGIPIFPVRRYRVCSLTGGYRFFGSLPMSVANKWHLFISLVLLACLIIYIVVNNESGGGSYTPSSAYKPSTYSNPSSPSTSTSEFQKSYRVPSYIKAELDRDSQVIDREKAKAEQMASQLDNLGREIEQKQSYLNKESQLDVDEYNSKVDTYNSLLERVRAQNRLVNQLVESYNNKLRQYGR
ncbi:MAG: tetratricopeptide repeat protein [Sedimentisphaerales bacterium]